MGSGSAITVVDHGPLTGTDQAVLALALVAKQPDAERARRLRIAALKVNRCSTWAQAQFLRIAREIVGEVAARANRLALALIPVDDDEPAPVDVSPSDDDNDEAMVFVTVLTPHAPPRRASCQPAWGAPA
jgi:hypothetical protein